MSIANTTRASLCTTVHADRWYANGLTTVGNASDVPRAELLNSEWHDTACDTAVFVSLTMPVGTESDSGFTAHRKITHRYHPINTTAVPMR